MSVNPDGESFAEVCSNEYETENGLTGVHGAGALIKILDIRWFAWVLYIYIYQV